VLSADLAAVAEEALAARGPRGAALRAARRFRLAQVSAEFDAVHLPEIVGTPVRMSKPLIATCHDLIPLRFPKQYLGFPPAPQVRKMMDLRRYRTADRIVCISPRTARDLEELLGIGAPKVSVAWLGIDLGRWRNRGEVSESLARLGVTAGKYLVYAGYSDYRKNVRGMLGALAYARRAGQEIDLVWAGHLPKHARLEVDEIARELGVTEHLKFLGFVDYQDLIALFRGALAHVFLSRLEGFGLSVAEAMAARCPVIVARDSGADDVAGDAALVVNPDDLEEAGRAVVRIATEPGLAESLRGAGEERSRLYDYRRMACDYVSVYREVTGA
jgi:glycosyltransferase involved in cell wall biosynthesis